MSMQQEISRVVHQGHAGDVYRLYEKKMLELEVNSGKGFCRSVSYPTTQNPCPVFVNEDTTARITNSSLDFTNVDKGYISGLIHVNIKMDDQVVPVINSTQTDSATSLIAQADSARPGTSNVYRIFVGFKAAIHVVKQYKLFCKTQDNLVFNSESIYQSSISRMILARASIENRPREYTTYKDARAFNKDIVCGTYLTVKEAFAGKRVEIPI